MIFEWVPLVELSNLNVIVMGKGEPGSLKHGKSEVFKAYKTISFKIARSQK